MTSKSKEMPKVKAMDSTFSLMVKPYDFLSECANELESDIFSLRLFGQKTVCLRGEDGAKIFYDPELTGRSHPPEMLRSTLTGKKGVQEIDGEEHTKRKALFMSFMNPVSINRLASEFDTLLERRTYRWRMADHVTVQEEMEELLTEAACEWVDVPVERDEIPQIAKMLSSLFLDAGAKSPRHLLARWNRHRAEIWIERLVNEAREGKLPLADHTPFSAFVNYRDAKGDLLPAKVCAVEILNLLRPIVAVSCYITFAVHALAEFPKVDKRRLRTDEKYLKYFIHEVRRYYPFFPAAIGRARKDIEWQSYVIPKGTRMVMDIYGMNHDSRAWNSPYVFMPERFATWNQSPFNFIPQGGGDHNSGHRCAGEFITLSLMSKAVHFFTGKIAYQLPQQDMTIQKDQTPGLPKSGMRLSQIMLATPTVIVRPTADMRDLDF